MMNLCLLAVVLIGIHAPSPGIPGSADTVGTAVLEPVFRDVEKGIIEGDAGLISKYFARQLSMSIPGNDPGYYSSNQAQFILQNFLNLHHTIRFHLTTTSSDDEYPFATGGGSFHDRGSVVRMQVYLSLMRQGDRWIITQFNIY